MARIAGRRPLQATGVLRKDVVPYNAHNIRDVEDAVPYKSSQLYKVDIFPSP
ncbi:MAG TPA: hypothetical protein PKX80_09490 [Flexilinea sp.]|jgi:hypothetical protein|nr:hypothetical protein [Flexilinea sp.]HQG89736.1 hypothetical protein [Flexilinea sp.]